MKTTITRRTALAASVTLPLLPVASYATPADPVVIAFAEWKALDRERARVIGEFQALEEQHGPFTRQPMAYDAATVRPLYTRLSAVEHRIAEMIATTPAGLAAQLRITMGWSDRDDLQGRLLRSMLAGAEGMANA